MTVEDFRAALREHRARLGWSQVQLGAELAHREGRDQPYSQGSVAEWEGSGKGTPPSRERVFSIEATMGLAPGTLSLLLGYLPPEAMPATSTVDAIRADPALTPDQRADLIHLYEGMVSRTSSARARRRGARR